MVVQWWHSLAILNKLLVNWLVALIPCRGFLWCFKYFEKYVVRLGILMLFVSIFHFPVGGTFFKDESHRHLPQFRFAFWKYIFKGFYECFAQLKHVLNNAQVKNISLKFHYPRLVFGYGFHWKWEQGYISLDCLLVSFKIWNPEMSLKIERKTSVDTGWCNFVNSERLIDIWKIFQC